MTRLRLPRFRVRTLMVLVAVVALGCWAIPPWWRWHHEMIRRSAAYTANIEITERGLAKYQRRSDASGQRVEEIRIEIEAWRHFATFP